MLRCEMWPCHWTGWWVVHALTMKHMNMFHQVGSFPPSFWSFSRDPLKPSKNVAIQRGDWKIGERKPKGVSQNIQYPICFLLERNWRDCWPPILLTLLQPWPAENLSWSHWCHFNKVMLQDHQFLQELYNLIVSTNLLYPCYFKFQGCMQSKPFQPYLYQNKTMAT